MEVRISRAELAQLTGTTIFTVSRLLSQWRLAGYRERSAGECSGDQPERSDGSLQG